MALVRSLPGSLAKSLASPLTGANGNLPPLLNSLVAYWDLSEASGDRADDSGNGYTLTDNNTVGSVTGVGAGQTAARFVAANTESLSSADSSLLASLDTGTQSFTAFFWLSADDTAAFQVAVNAGGADISGWDVIFFSGSARFRARNAADTGRVEAIGGAVANSTYASVCVGYDASSEVIFASVNNAARVTTAASGGITSAASVFRIGTSLTGAAQAVGIWARVLTTGERTYLHNGGTAARLYADLGAYTA